MTDEFIKSLAKTRAEELFTKEFFETATDSWYLDEMFRFESMQLPVSLETPTEEEADKYMSWMHEYKNIYEDNYYTSENALFSYQSLINKLHEVIDEIEESKKRYKAFECSPEITLKIKQVGNYFVELYNQEYQVYKSKHKDE